MPYNHDAGEREEARVRAKRLSAERRSQLWKLIGCFPREKEEEKTWHHSNSRRVQAAMVVALQTFARALKGCDHDGAENPEVRPIFWLAQMDGAGDVFNGWDATTSTDNFIVQIGLSTEQIKQLGAMVMAPYEFWRTDRDHDGVFRTMNQFRAPYILWTRSGHAFAHDFLETTNGTEQQIMVALNELRNRVGLPRQACRGLRSIEEWLWWHLRNYAAAVALADERQPRTSSTKTLGWDEWRIWGQGA